MKLSLAMIVRNSAEEVPLLTRLFKSIEGVFDEKCITVTHKEGKGTEINKELALLLERKKCKVANFTWVDDFSRAREFSFEQTTGDLICWLDSDDEVKGAKQLKEFVNMFKRDELLGAVWFAYYYDFDKQGNCTSVFWRERVVRRGWFEWKGALHENLLQKFECKHYFHKDTKLRVEHHLSTEEIIARTKRNQEVIIKQYNREAKEGAIDPRTVYDLARTLHATGNFAKAFDIFKQFTQVTESDNDRYDAFNRMAEIARASKNFELATDYSLLAMRLKPTWPDAYLGLAECYFSKADYNACIEMIRTASTKEVPLGAFPTDPTKYEYKPLFLLQDALFRKGDAEQALQVQERILSVYPDNKWIKSCYSYTKKFLKQMRTENLLISLAKQYESDKQFNEVKHLLQAVPKESKDHPIIKRMTNKYFPKIKSNRIVIYCGPSYENWSPMNVDKGIGGSEEAVINMAQELNKLGWVVDVYNTCDVPGDYDGVNYHNCWEHDQKEPCDVFIAWRMAEYIDLAPEGSLKFLWCHDVQKMEYYSPRLIEKIDKIFVLSKAHRTNLPDIPDEKFYITRNGINPSHFSLNGHKRNPLKCIYASSPDRGLDILLEQWPKIIKEVPNAELHVFYGFQAHYDEIHKNNYSMINFKRKIIKQINTLPNVFYRGRVGHKELANEFESSGLWLYPSPFFEISCITSMKAQASGMIPITTTTGALDETTQHGVKIKGDIHQEKEQNEWLGKAIDLLKNPSKQENIRKPMQDWAVKNFSWSSLAVDWGNLFKELKCQKTQEVAKSKAQ